MIKQQFLFWILFLCLHINAEAQKKHVLVESLSGAWCGFCPDASVLMDEFVSHNGVIPISIQIADIMEIPEGKILSDEHTGGGVPAFFIDRKMHSNTDFLSYGLERENILESLLLQLNETPICDVAFTSFSYNATTNLLSVGLEAVFFENYSQGNLRFNLYVLRKEVQSTDNDYYQANFYNFTEDHAYQNAGNPIKDYIHNNILVKMLGGTWGTPNSLRSSMITKGEKLKFTYSFPVDPNFKIKNLKLVGLVQQYSDDISNIEIINSNQLDFMDGLNGSFLDDSNVGINTIENIDFLLLYPNPVNNFLNIAFNSLESQKVKFHLINQLGQTIEVFSKSVNAGSNKEAIKLSKDLESGIYFLNIETQSGAIISRKVMIHN